jgi:hypothetical protein
VAYFLANGAEPFTFYSNITLNLCLCLVCREAMFLRCCGDPNHIGPRKNWNQFWGICFVGWTAPLHLLLSFEIWVSHGHGYEDVKSCILVDFHKRFGDTCCLHLQGRSARARDSFTRKMEAAGFSETLITCYQTAWCHTQNESNLHIRVLSSTRILI